MHLVEILLPLHDNEGVALSETKFASVRRTLTERFGGLTAFTRAPADGFWKSSKGDPKNEEIVVFEVMVEIIEPAWWSNLRHDLENTFRQDEIVIRAHMIERL